MTAATVALYMIRRTYLLKSIMAQLSEYKYLLSKFLHMMSLIRFKDVFYQASETLSYSGIQL